SGLTTSAMTCTSTSPSDPIATPPIARHRATQLRPTPGRPCTATVTPSATRRATSATRGSLTSCANRATRSANMVCPCLLTDLPHLRYRHIVSASVPPLYPVNDNCWVSICTTYSGCLTS